MFKEYISKLFKKIFQIQETTHSEKLTSEQKVLKNIKIKKTLKKIYPELDNYSIRAIEGAIGLNDIKVREVMIPKANLVYVSIADTFDEVLEKIIENKHSRYPIIEEINSEDGSTKEKVHGILLAKDLIEYLFNKKEDSQTLQKNFDVTTVAREVFYVPESKRLNFLLGEFLDKSSHMAVVLDEYSDMSGIITIEDILEEIVGEIEDEHDVIDDEELIKPNPKNKNIYWINSSILIVDFNDYFKTNLADEEISSIGGLLIKTHGDLPKINQVIEIGENLLFKIVKMSDRRIEGIQLKISDPIPKE